MSKKDVFFDVLKDVLKVMKKNDLYKKEDLKGIINHVKNCYFNHDFTKINFFSYGNKKLAKNVMIFNMPSVMTCACSCKGCYAKKAERLYKNTRMQRLKNMFIIMLALKDYNFKKIVKNIFIKSILAHGMMLKNPIFRVHESGDFFNKKYLNYWLNIIETVHALDSNIKFYSYSKQLDTKTIQKINKTYKNFNIVMSFINIKGKIYLNYGHEDYIENMKKLLKKEGIKYHVCDYGHGNNMACGINCHACCLYDVVLFYQH